MARSAVSWKEEGAARFREGRWRDAADAWSAAIDSEDPTDKEFLAACYANRCAARLKIGSEALRSPALRDADDCVRLRPSWARGHGRRGQALCSLNRLAEASVAFTKASSLEPSNREYSAAAKESYEAAQSAYSQREKEQHGTSAAANDFDFNECVARWSGQAMGFLAEHRQSCLQALFVLFAIWLLFGRGGGASYGSPYGFGGGMGGGYGVDGSNLGYMAMIGAAAYVAHKNGMSPFQIMMLLNMFNRRGGRRGYGGGFGGRGFYPRMGGGGMGGFGGRQRWF